jgi:hypothetical protein
VHSTACSRGQQTCPHLHTALPGWMSMQHFMHSSAGNLGLGEQLAHHQWGPTVLFMHNLA